MKYIYIIIVLIFAFAGLLPAFTQEEPSIIISYPANNAVIQSNSTFLVGSTLPGAILTINDEQLRVYPDGGFVKVVSLKKGENRFYLRSKFKEAQNELVYTINVPEAPKPIKNTPLIINKSSIKPDEDVLLQPGDKLSIEFRGSKENKASYSIGELQEIPMNEVYKESKRLSDREYQGIYRAVYTVDDADNFINSPVIVKLSSSAGSIIEASRGYLTVLPKNASPIVAEVIKDYAAARNSPDGERLTPLNKGTRLNITGKRGKYYRYSMGDAASGWVLSSDISILPPQTPYSKSKITSINLSESMEDVYIRIPLNAKLPLTIDELPDSSIKLNIYGSFADNDLLIFNNCKNFISNITYSQLSNKVFQLDIIPAFRQIWGYDYYYEDNTLILRIKKPLYADSEAPLKNKTITIDPGHGGSEKGSVGPTGVPEKTINLAIASYLKDLLQNAGANVIMTRTSNDSNVGLYDRVRISDDNHSDVLISIHNNALPDGRDPYKEHGSSTYYYYPQALPLAQSIQKSLLEVLGLNDYGIHRNSLVLTRSHRSLAVLVEVGFMINPEEYIFLNNSDFQKKAALAIYNGLENFLKGICCKIKS